MDGAACWCLASCAQVVGQCWVGAEDVCRAPLGVTGGPASASLPLHARKGAHTLTHTCIRICTNAYMHTYTHALQHGHATHTDLLLATPPYLPLLTPTIHGHHIPLPSWALLEAVCNSSPHHTTPHHITPPHTPPHPTPPHPTHSARASTLATLFSSCRASTLPPRTSTLPLVSRSTPNRH